MLTTDKKHHPGLWISVLYFAEGLPYTVVNLMSVIFFKDVGATNEFIGLTSFLYLPWVLKGFWGLLVDIYSTKRFWILTTEIICIFLFFLLALSVLISDSLTVSIIIFAAIAFVSATHDIAIDGFYLSALSKEQQALYVGVQTTAYKVAWLAGNGGLVFLAGYFANQYIVGTTETNIRVFRDINFSLFDLAIKFHPLRMGWSLAFILAGIILLLIYIFQLWYLPHLESNLLEYNKDTYKNQFFHVFKKYFSQYRIAWIFTYIITFRLGDAFMLKMTPPFLMDKFGKGGLGISTAEVGYLYGIVGIVFLLIGGIIGGYLIAKQGLKKWLLPTAILQNSAILIYWILAVYKPSITWVYFVNAFEQFSYGIGVSAYTVFLMSNVNPEYKTSHYAITTALMATGIFIPGLFSGYIETRVGYEYYFLLSFFVSVPGLITIFFLPLED
ncbi:MFS transporter [Fischerella sp. PCC 9605]|uniref:MFS transporter n=1 Tax=Fischerella sp. PCC 9605 TaxID=1173024 RepID=UPI0004B65B54|nr:MFS transporter [Fischerella sp. PCC 9605]